VRQPKRLHEIVGDLLDGAVQIKTRWKWKWLKGPRKRPRRAVNAQEATALPYKISTVSRTLAADMSDLLE
jgi:hypothetical protein